MSKRFNAARGANPDNYGPSGTLGYLGATGTSTAVGVVGNAWANKLGRDTPGGQAVGLATGIGAGFLAGGPVGAVLGFATFIVSILTTKNAPSIEQLVWQNYSASAGQYAGSRYDAAYFECAFQGWWREKATELDVMARQFGGDYQGHEVFKAWIQANLVNAILTGTVTASMSTVQVAGFILPSIDGYYAYHNSGTTTRTWSSVSRQVVIDLIDRMINGLDVSVYAIAPYQQLATVAFAPRVPVLRTALEGAGLFSRSASSVTTVQESGTTQAIVLDNSPVALPVSAFAPAAPTIPVAGTPLQTVTNYLPQTSGATYLNSSGQIIDNATGSIVPSIPATALGTGLAPIDVTPYIRAAGITPFSYVPSGAAPLPTQMTVVPPAQSVTSVPVPSAGQNWWLYLILGGAALIALS